MMLNADAQACFAKDGYLILEDRFSTQRCDELCERVQQHAAAASAPTDGFWQQMARSRDKVEAFLKPGEGPAESRLMRMGHGLHLVDDVFRAACREPWVVGALKTLTEGPLEIIQSAVICKQPTSDDVQFGAHQDAWYLTTGPESLVLAFVALDDMDLENGCLEVIPGSHRDGLTRQLKMTPTGYVRVAGNDHDDARERTPLIVPRGTVVLVAGRTVHASGPNRSSGPRRALITHYKSRRSQMASTAWVQAPPHGFPLA